MAKYSLSKEYGRRCNLCHHNKRARQYYKPIKGEWLRVCEDCWNKLEKTEETSMNEQGIFNGKNSKQLWDDINSIKDKKTHTAIYHLACKCQELEALVRKTTNEE